TSGTRTRALRSWSGTTATRPTPDTCTRTEAAPLRHRGPGPAEPVFPPYRQGTARDISSSAGQRRTISPMVGSVEPQTPHAESVPAHPPLESLAVQPLVNRDYESRPALFYERLRAEYGPVAPVDVLGVPAWLVIGYSQPLDLLRDARGLW